MCTRAIAPVVDIVGEGVPDASDGEGGVGGEAEVGGVAMVESVGEVVFVVIIKQFDENMSSGRLVRGNVFENEGEDRVLSLSVVVYSLFIPRVSLKIRRTDTDRKNRAK
jgi:hypothetical protein